MTLKMIFAGRHNQVLRQLKSTHLFQFPLTCGFLGAQQAVKVQRSH